RRRERTHAERGNENLWELKFNMAATALDPGNLASRTPRRLPFHGRMIVVFAALLLLPIAPKLARLAGAEDEAKKLEKPVAAKPETAPEPKAVAPVLASTNPRGEPL